VSVVEQVLPQPIEGSPSKQDWRQQFRDYYELAKPGIGFYAVISAFASYWLASPQPLDYVLLLHTMLATAFVTAGGGALNQVIEVETDKRMRRTENRPLPSGRVPLRHGIIYGAFFSVLGVVYLLLAVNTLTAVLAAGTLLGYLIIYTPLKKKSHLSTIVGGFPGAIPILIGWAAVRGSLDLSAWVLFTILFFWQIPHFLAIAWMYRKDYARAGFPMLSVLDEEGMSVAFQAVIYVIALVPVTLMLTMIGLTGYIYFAGAFVLGLGFLATSIYCAMKRTNTSAKQLLLASILYLPLLLALMVIDKQ
jgi:heme o synthase